MARKALKTEIPAAHDASLDQAKLDGAMVQMRADAQEDLADLCDLAGSVKAIQMADLTANFLAAAKVRLFEQVRTSKKIKDLPIRTAEGGFATAKDIGEFCQLVFGRPYTTMFEASQNLEALGEEAYEVANRLGLNRSALRAARALPPESLETVRLAIAGGSTKAEVLSVIEDLAVRIEETEQALADARGDLEAKEHLLAEKGKRIDQLKAAQKRIEKLPPDAQLVDLQKEATAIMRDASGAVTGGLRQAIIAVRNHGDEDHTAFLAGLVGQVQAELSALREEFGLPDTSAAAQQELAADAAQWLKKA